MQEKDMIYKIAGRYLLSLIKEALRGEQLQKEPEGCSWEQIYALAESNSVEAVSFYGLSKKLVPEKLYAKWKEKANITLFRQLSFEAEREKILSGLEEQGISYLPLKGILIVSYYPKPGMRSMADNDILYGILEQRSEGGVQPAGKNDKEKEDVKKGAQEQIRVLMTGLGYNVYSLKGNHDSYIKEPCYNFELHHQLMGDESTMYSYYEDVWSRAIADERNPYAYSFSDEDEYVYFLAHAFKHYSNCGCGIRCIIDLYVFLQKKGEGMDWKYIEEELEKLSLSEFERCLKALSLHAFEEGELDEQDEKMLLYMLGSGTYGIIQNYFSNSLNRLKEECGGDTKRYKMRYWKKRLFLDKETCKDSFPFFYKHYWLIGLLLIYRVFRAILARPGAVINELKCVWHHK